VSVQKVVVGTNTYIAISINATKQYSLNFSALAVRNASGIYVLASPSTQKIACWDGSRWHNGTGAVGPMRGNPVCWFQGLDTPVFLTPIYSAVPAFPLTGLSWALAVAPVLFMFWRRMEVAGVVSFAVGVFIVYQYSLFGLTVNQAVALSIVMITLGVLMILLSKAGE
jgi:hypothetical protein